MACIPRPFFTVTAAGASHAMSRNRGWGGGTRNALFLRGGRKKVNESEVTAML